MKKVHFFNEHTRHGWSLCGRVPTKFQKHVLGLNPEVTNVMKDVTCLHCKKNFLKQIHWMIDAFELKKRDTWTYGYGA